MKFENLIENTIIDESENKSFVIYFNRYYEISLLMKELIVLTKKGVTDNIVVANILSEKSNKNISASNISEIKSKILLQLSQSTVTPIDSIRFKVKLIKPKWLYFLTRRLTFLYNVKVMIVLSAIGLVSLSIAILKIFESNNFKTLSTSFQPLELISASLIFTLIILFHELGHSTASAKYNIALGWIGFGVYFFTPVFYSDTTQAWKLPPKQRLVIDFGGIYFQLILIPLLTFFYFINNSQIAEYLIILNILTIITNLNPLLKYDGYWIFSDLLNITNLRSKTTDITRHFILKYIFMKPVTENKALKKITQRAKVFLISYTVITNLLFFYFFFFYIPKFLYYISFDLKGQIVKLYFQFTEHSFIYFIQANISNIITIILNVFIGLFLLITIIRFIKSIFLFFKTQVLVKINNF